MDEPQLPQLRIYTIKCHNDRCDFYHRANPDETRGAMVQPVGPGIWPRLEVECECGDIPVVERDFEKEREVKENLRKAQSMSKLLLPGGPNLQ